jgi:hypothetical protein
MGSEDLVARINKLEAQLTEARNTERAAVVRWLMRDFPTELNVSISEADLALEEAAIEIERGDHVSSDPR